MTIMPKLKMCKHETCLFVMESRRELLTRGHDNSKRKWKKVVQLVDLDK
jgi:hypothetical protein